MPICTETYRSKRCANFNLFHLFTFHYVVEEYATIKTRTAEEKIVHWTEGNTCADVVVCGKLEAQWITLGLRRVQLGATIFVLSYNLL